MGRSLVKLFVTYAVAGAACVAGQDVYLNRKVYKMKAKNTIRKVKQAKNKLFQE